MDESCNRRTFIKKSGITVAATLVAGELFPMSAKGMTLAELRAERRKLAHRRRRIIFYNDGDELSHPGADTPEGLLKVRTTALLGSQVDSISYYADNGLKLYLSDNPYSKLYACADPTAAPAFKNLRQLLKNYGKDALEVMIDTCRQRDMEILYANRMNVTDSMFYNPPVFWNITEKHPEYMLSSLEESQKYKFPDVRSFGPNWNYELPMIRKMTVDALREICQSYDVDGIELQFVRAAIYFRSTLEGKPTTPEQNEMITEMVRQIRRMTEEEGLKRGRPFLVDALIPFNSTLSRFVGLDVEAWLQEGLIDILTAGPFAPMTMPMKGVIDLGHRYGVPVYPWLANYDYKNATGDAITAPDFPMYRGDALFRYWEGADGMYMYNVFDPTLPLWREVGDAKQLRTMSRSYVWDYLPSQRNVSNLLWDVRSVSLEHRPVVPVSEGGSEAIPLMLGEGPGQKDAEGMRDGTLRLRLHVKGLTRAQGFTVKVNGRGVGEAIDFTQPGQKDKGLWLEFSPPAKLFHAGENLIEAALAEHWERTANPPQIDQARLDVKGVSENDEAGADCACPTV